MTLKNRRVLELRLGKLGLILFVGGMSVLLFSFFLIGIVIGKHMEAYPERYSTGILEMIDNRLFTALPQVGKTASPEAELEKKEDPSGADAEAVPAGDDTAMGKKGTAAPESQPVGEKHKTPDADVGQPLLPGGPPRPSAKAAGGTTVETTRPLPAVGGEGAVKKAVPPPEGKPAGDPADRKPPADETEVLKKGRYEVQAAAYRERAQADHLAKKFENMGFPSQVVMKEIPGKGQWFRVIVGGFENREKAQEAVDQLTGKIRGLKCVIRSTVKSGNGG